jgi:hypothetical protein
MDFDELVVGAVGVPLDRVEEVPRVTATLTCTTRSSGFTYALE